MAKVVLVEDDVDLRNSLADYLTVAGHEVSGFGSAVELYQRLAHETFDAAVLDVQLPHHDGLSIARYLAEQTQMAVIMATVRSDVEDRIAGYRSGADLYLSKPVDCQELAAAIDALVARRRGSRVAELPEPEPSGEVWLLDRARFTLATPDGCEVSLTRREMMLIERVARTPGEIVSRDEMMRFSGSEGAGEPGRSLDVSISRLRSKVQGLSQHALPLQTVYGTGFLFAGTVRRI